MVSERFKFLSLLILALISLAVAVSLSVAIDAPNESVRGVIETCSITWKVCVAAVAWCVWRRRRSLLDELLRLFARMISH